MFVGFSTSLREYEYNPRLSSEEKKKNRTDPTSFTQYYIKFETNTILLSWRCWSTTDVNDIYNDLFFISSNFY
jgi:hypothetical protein